VKSILAVYSSHDPIKLFWSTRHFIDSVSHKEEKVSADFWVNSNGILTHCHTTYVIPISHELQLGRLHHPAM
jgi:hypothetical protein